MHTLPTNQPQYYHKACIFSPTQAGEVSHALDLCFQHHHYDVLDVISEDLHEGSSQETTQRVADYYMEKGLFDKAMEILVRTRRTEEAMKLCVQHSVPLTEELVERISIQKGDNGRLASCDKLCVLFNFQPPGPCPLNLHWGHSLLRLLQ